jgi:hypothetical protein
MSIAAGPRGRVYVADTVKLQIFVFGEDSPPLSQAFFDRKRIFP